MTRNERPGITVTCNWCGDSAEYTNTDHGRQMVNIWPENHRCANRAQTPWRAN